MGKPVQFKLKGEGNVVLAKKDLKKYLKSIVSGDDIINVSVKTPKSITMFPIMRKQFSLVDPAFMLEGGFRVDQIGETNSFKVYVDGIVSTTSLGMKELDLISMGSVTCALDHVGTRDAWNLDGDGGSDPLDISVS
jgi:hypothetical protein